MEPKKGKGGKEKKIGPSGSKKGEDHRKKYRTDSVKKRDGK